MLERRVFRFSSISHNKYICMIGLKTLVSLHQNNGQDGEGLTEDEVVYNRKTFFAVLLFL